MQLLGWRCLEDHEISLVGQGKWNREGRQPIKGMDQASYHDGDVELCKTVKHTWEFSHQGMRELWLLYGKSCHSWELTWNCQLPGSSGSRCLGERTLSYSAMSDCLHPNGLQPTQLLCSWDSPGKNTRVGCHFLLQGNLPNPGIKPESSALAGRFFTTEPPGKPLAYGVQWQRSPLRKRWRCCLLEAGLTNTKVRQVTEYGQGINNVHNFQRLTRLNCTVLEVVKSYENA